MTPEEIKALIAESFAGLKSEIMGDVTQANKGLAASLNRELKKTLEGIQKPAEQAEESAEGNTEKLSLKALKAELAALQQERESERQEAFQARKNSAVASLVAGHELNNPGTVQKLFLSEFGDRLKAEGPDWFVDNSDGSVLPLASAFEGYLKTPEGSYFIKPSGVLGSGSKEAKSPVVGSTKTAPNSIGSALASRLTEQ